MDKLVNNSKKMLLINYIIVALATIFDQWTKKLIEPLKVDDETYIKLWKEQSYEGLGFDKSDNSSFYSSVLSYSSIITLGSSLG